MIRSAGGSTPRLDASAGLAPSATVVGDVEVGPNCWIGFGAVLLAEGGPIRIGANCIIMENAVLRAVRGHPLSLGDNVLVGPRACLTGCTVAENAFLATGATVFNAARIGARAEIRINGIVHLRTVLPDDAVVPPNWIAVGDPARILPPDRHDEIWALQEALDFPRTVFGVERPPRGGTIMPEIMPRYARRLRRLHGIESS